MKQISAGELMSWLADGARAAPFLLDVRESWEFEIGHIAGSVHVPMGEIPGRIAEFDPNADTVVICHHGSRSQQVAVFLERQGFARVHNLAGGVHAWSQVADPAMPVY